ncbi:MAG: hypothetical protein ACR2RE_22380, partial [Geminicoccaceae bacterium]
MADAQKVVNLGQAFVDPQTRDVFEALTDQGKVRAVLSNTASLDFGSIAANLAADLTITVNGARANDIALVGPPAAPDSEITFTAFVSADDTVT